MIATMNPEQRKFALSIHVTTSVGLLGAIAAFWPSRLLALLATMCKSFVVRILPWR